MRAARKFAPFLPLTDAGRAALQVVAQAGPLVAVRDRRDRVVLRQDAWGVAVFAPDRIVLTGTKRCVVEYFLGWNPLRKRLVDVVRRVAAHMF